MNLKMSNLLRHGSQAKCVPVVLEVDGQPNSAQRSAARCKPIAASSAVLAYADRTHTHVT